MQCDTRTVSLDGEGVVRLPSLRSVPTLPCFWVVQSLSSSTSQTTAQNVVRVIYVRNLTSSELLRFLVSQINVLEADPTFAYPMWSVHCEQRALTSSLLQWDTLRKPVLTNKTACCIIFVSVTLSFYGSIANLIAMLKSRSTMVILSWRPMAISPSFDLSVLSRTD